ncbi:hypothetical protein V6N11_065171 [Hibiscus sabdariffa]|uniref:Uncharacterized protein n=1 Tax=Hibiscus sabdariffa TaxID=183260 RepID=A0ABR2QG51_9ROSI
MDLSKSVMSKPNSPQALTLAPQIVGSANGRPPDECIVVEDVMMDRPRSPLLEDAQRQTKKGRSIDHSDNSLDFAMTESDTGIGLMNLQPQKPSFREMLIGGSKAIPEKKSLCDLDVDVAEDDVTSRKRRPGVARQEGNIVPTTDKDHQILGSRFAPLSDDNVVEVSPENSVPVGTLLNQANRGIASGILNGSPKHSLALVESSKGNAIITTDKGKVVLHRNGMVRGKQGVSRKGDTKVSVGMHVETSALVASRDKVIPAMTSLNKETHTVVHIESSEDGSILHRNHDRLQPKVSNGSRPKGGSKGALRIKGVPPLNKKGRKQADKGTKNVAIASCVSSLMSDLDRAKGENSCMVSGVDNSEEAADALIQWCDNGAYENKISDDMQL